MLDDIKKTLWATADKLRANMDAAEYKHLVLGLIFVKYISDTFSAHRTRLALRMMDPDDEYFFGQASAEDLATELEDRDYYTEANIFWVPEAARWEALRAAAKQPEIGKRIDDTLILIEAENPRLKGILDKRYARAQLPDGKLGELVDLISTVGFGDTILRNQYRDLRADFILANPAFNFCDWWNASLSGDPRWAYGEPPAGNANRAARSIRLTRCSMSKRASLSSIATSCSGRGNCQA